MTYEIRIDGGQGGTDTIEAASMAEAKELAREWAEAGDWDTSEGTAYCDVSVQEIRYPDEMVERIREIVAADAGAGDMDVDPQTLGAWVLQCTTSAEAAIRAEFPSARVRRDAAGDLDVEVGAGESDTISVSIDQPEPDCPSDEGQHDWQSPIEVVGGIAENPGCWGHGGGAIVTEVCVRCGCSRKTDTWAQRSDTGEQGLTEVTYEEGKFADEVRAMAEAE